MQKQKIKAFLQLLNTKKNKDILFAHRQKAGLPQYGIDWSKGGINLVQYDIQTLAKHYGAYRALLAHNNPRYFDIFTSQDKSVDDFLFEYFVFNQQREETIKKTNLSGCELISISDQNHKPDLFKGVYLRIGTNNTIKNVKDFINQNSEKILNAQRKISSEKPIRLKPSEHYLRDNFIYNFAKYGIKDLLVLAKKDGLFEIITERLKDKKIEKKEIIIQVYVEKLFGQKMSLGAIRKTFLGNKNSTH